MGPRSRSLLRALSWLPMCALVLAVLHIVTKLPADSLPTASAADQAHQHPLEQHRTLERSWAAPKHDPKCKKLIWIMGVRENSELPDFIRYLQAALLSAQHNAPSLLPHVIFSGAPSQDTAFFERHGGRLILHELTFEPLLKDAETSVERMHGWFDSRGAFMRLDIPYVWDEIMAPFADDPMVEKEHFLYTDADIMFNTDITSCSFESPPLFTIGAEHVRGTAANTGVMYINAAAFAQHQPAIIEFAVANQWKWPTFDQGLLLQYVEQAGIHVPVLPDQFNWKGYWGYDTKADPEPAIFHFHGPKPERCLPCLCAHVADYTTACTQEEHGCFDVYKELFNEGGDDGMMYKRMMQLYHGFRWDAEHT